MGTQLALMAWSSISRPTLMYAKLGIIFRGATVLSRPFVQEYHDILPNLEVINL